MYNMDRTKAKDWTKQQKEKANKIANEFLSGRLSSIPQE